MVRKFPLLGEEENDKMEPNRTTARKNGKNLEK